MRDGWLSLPANARGALWITVGTVFFAVNDTFVKTVGLNIHPAQMAFFRYCVGFLILSPLFLRAGRAGLRTQRLPLHLARALIASTAQAMVFYAIVHLMLADATAITFSRPMFMTLLAVLLLGEAVGWRRWTATAIGFLGVLVMVRPGYVALDAAWIVALVAAFLFGLGLVIIRRLSSTEPPIRILFLYHAFGIVLFAAPAAWLWKTPAANEWLMLIMIGVLTTVGMACFVRGFSAGEASIVGPMEYTRLVYAAIIGYFVFAEVPSVWTWVGAAIIVASALYIAQREAFAGAADNAAPPPAG